jgi:Asp-tRNA(Asn)/Glu-tRNA(Gln) amidotransferase A subunit family amidase
MDGYIPDFDAMIVTRLLDHGATITSADTRQEAAQCMLQYHYRFDYDPLAIRGKNTRTFNFTGHPAISVPSGKAGGLPIGLQLVARLFDQVNLLRASYVVQKSINYEHLPMVLKQTVIV